MLTQPKLNHESDYNREAGDVIKKGLPQIYILRQPLCWKSMYSLDLLALHIKHDAATDNNVLFSVLIPHGCHPLEYSSHQYREFYPHS